MKAKILQLTKDQYLVSNWSGGTTTQIAIAPKNAVYADRDFLWRVSSAIIELEESEFTSLVDYHRVISLLDGDMVLTHENDLPIVINPFDTHSFDGGIKTTSKGRCTDFNLMLRKGRCTGGLIALHLAGERASISNVLDGIDCDAIVIFCAVGEGRLISNHDSYKLCLGESVLMENPCYEDLILTSESNSRYLIAHIKNL